MPEQEPILLDKSFINVTAHLVAGVHAQRRADEISTIAKIAADILISTGATMSDISVDADKAVSLAAKIYNLSREHVPN